MLNPYTRSHKTFILFPCALRSAVPRNSFRHRQPACRSFKWLLVHFCSISLRFGEAWSALVYQSQGKILSRAWLGLA